MQMSSPIFVSSNTLLGGQDETHDLNNRMSLEDIVLSVISIDDNASKFVLFKHTVVGYETKTPLTYVNFLT